MVIYFLCLIAGIYGMWFGWQEKEDSILFALGVVNLLIFISGTIIQIFLSVSG
jgi:drug/metabolite transporter superfamily protein YnfA